MFKAVIGQAEGTDTVKTMACVLSQCKVQLENMKPTAGIFYAANHFDHEQAMAEINKSYPGIELAGCTTDGEMSSAQGFSQDSLCLMLFASDTISMTAGFTPDVSNDPSGEIKRLVTAAAERMGNHPKGCLVFAGPKRSRKRIFLKELHRQLGPGCQIFGGVAGTNDFNARNSSLLHSAGVARDGLSILFFAGPLKIESVICNSWEPVGYKSVIEKTDGNIIKRIGGRTALEFYRHTFGPYAQPLPEMPLALFDDEGRFHLRSTRDFDESDGSICTPIAIPEGSTIQLTEATPNKMLSSLDKNLRSICKNAEETWMPQAAILLSCSSRRWILGMRTNEEIEQATTVFPKNIPIIGFYTFGEIAALAEGKSPKMHNCTMVALLMGEEENTEAGFTPHKYDRQCFTEEEKTKLMGLKMERARESQRRLEIQKESFTNVLRRISSDLAEANRKIKKHNLVMQESLTMAQEVQQSLLPNYSPIVKGFKVVGRSISCDETGGDYLDYLPDDNGLSVVVGDVAGHGVAAALVMTTARALLRMRADIGGSPVDLINDLNRLLTEDVRISGRFMTFFYLYLNSTDRTLTWIRAGHDPALLYSPETGKFTELMGEGVALGIMEDFKFSQYQTPPLKTGEIVFINTDGITEAHAPSGELYGRARLKNFIRKNAEQPIHEILDSCFSDIQNYQQGLPRKDDETVVIIKGC